MICNMFGGEDLNEFEIGDFERPPQQFFVYLSLFKENKSGRDSTGFNTGESKLYWIKEHYYMEH